MNVSQTGGHGTMWTRANPLEGLISTLTLACALAPLTGCVAFKDLGEAPPPAAAANNGGTDNNGDDRNNGEINNGETNNGDDPNNGDFEWDCDLMCSAVIECLDGSEEVPTTADCLDLCRPIERELRECFDDSPVVECDTLIPCALQFEPDHPGCADACSSLSACASALRLPASINEGCQQECNHAYGGQGPPDCSAASTCIDQVTCLDALVDALVGPCERACLSLTSCDDATPTEIGSCMSACSMRGGDTNLIACVAGSAEICANTDVCVGSETQNNACEIGCRKRVICGDVTNVDELEDCVTACGDLSQLQQSCNLIIDLPAEGDTGGACQALNGCDDSTLQNCELTCLSLQYHVCPDSFATSSCLADCRTHPPQPLPRDVEVSCFGAREVNTTACDRYQASCPYAFVRAACGCTD